MSQTSSDSSSPAASAAAELSLLTPIGYQSGDCGYCKPEGSSGSYYTVTKALSPEHYQELVDRGWRRSGQVLYLPDAHRSCCPHYTIRLPVAEFKPTRDQRQAINRWNKFVLGEKYIRESILKYPKTKEEKKRLQTTFNLSATVHESESRNLHPDIESDHKFEVTLESDDFTEEKFALFDNYQRHVHGEGDADISRSGFKRFLCHSPLTRSTEPSGKGLGSLHQCYRLDGRLIAMGVLDLLPHTVSGVYFIYHSDFEKWSFGKLSALREASLALEQGYDYYYMGYYIHGCKKMRYKADYRPQHVLDFHSLEWNELDDGMRDLMDRPRYTSMSQERSRKLQEQMAGSSEALPGASRTSQEENLDGVHEATRDDYQFADPTAAMQSRRSLLEIGMPGVMSLEDLHSQIDLDAMQVKLGRHGVFEVQDLQGWSTGSETETRSIRGIVAEFAAAVGPLIAREIVMEFP